MKYRLIKEYPGSYPLGVVFETDSKEWINDDHCILKSQEDLEKWPEYYCPINEHSQDELWEKFFDDMSIELDWDSCSGPYLPNKAQEKIKRLYTLIRK